MRNIEINKLGRKRLWYEDMVARFPEGTFKRIDSVLDPNETRTDFIRAAVTREIAWRTKLGPVATGGKK